MYSSGNEILKRLKKVVKIGYFKNFVNGKAIVSFSGKEIECELFLQQGFYKLPEKEDRVSVVFLEGECKAVCLGVAQLTIPEGFDFNNGDAIMFNKKGSILLKGNGDIIIDGSKLEIKGDVFIKGNLKSSGNAEITGNIKNNGKIESIGEIKSNTDIKANLISLMTHTHGTSQGPTTPPIP